ncbi:MAG: ABC transporter ATP-binding protein [Dehalococcoidia bacterium]|nr:ABC transporter ATP-binding protein [Dehalococcoidia bacterium]
MSQATDQTETPGPRAATAPIIQAIEVSRDYQLAGETVHAVRSVNLDVRSGEFITLVGRSGSGKTTLLNMLAGLDHPTSGKVLFQGTDLAGFTEKQFTLMRRHKIGVVFQSFALLPLLSAYENVELPMRIAGLGASERSERTRNVLEMVGLERRAKHRPYELSGGEQQRISIARAVAMRPDVILADEPTGELDSVNAAAIFGLFRQMVTNEGMSIVATTHDRTLLDLADRIYTVHDGELELSEVGQRIDADEPFRRPDLAPGSEQAPADA